MEVAHAETHGGKDPSGSDAGITPAETLGGKDPSGTTSGSSAGVAPAETPGGKDPSGTGAEVVQKNHMKPQAAAPQGLERRRR